MNNYKEVAVLFINREEAQRRAIGFGGRTRYNLAVCWPEAGHHLLAVWEHDLASYIVQIGSRVRLLYDVEQLHPVA